MLKELVHILANVPQDTLDQLVPKKFQCVHQTHVKMEELVQIMEILILVNAHLTSLMKIVKLDPMFIPSQQKQIQKEDQEQMELFK